MNYYNLLGVQPDAEQEVIKAAYKALSKKYHPDTSSLPKSEAEARMKEINEAYEVLSNYVKRTEYDKEFDSSQYATDDDNINEAFDDYFEEKWAFAIEYFPRLSKYFNELSEVSTSLAQSYRITIILYQDYDKALSIKKKMLTDFMNRYFGKDPLNHKLALFLIENKETEAAKELNRAICQFGDKLRPYQLEKKIIEKYGIVINEVDTSDSKDADALNGSDTTIAIIIVFIIIMGIMIAIGQ